MAIEHFEDEPVGLDMEGTEITARMMEGNELWIGMRETSDPELSKIWEFHNVAGFYDDLARVGKVTKLQVAAPRGKYAAHLAKELKRPEVKDYREVHMFAEGQEIACLSVCSEKFEMRPPTIEDMWMVKLPEEMNN